MKRSRRLLYIASNITESVIADIGCDHALVCIEAIEQCRARKAYACDVRPGPLKQAAANISLAGLSGQIVCRQASGLENLPDDVQELVIAGMGAHLIIDILSQNPPKNGVTSMILSSHKDTPALRQWLCGHGWRIDREKVIDEGHFYPVLFVRRARGWQILDRDEIEFGVNVQEDGEWTAMMEKEKARLQDRLKNMPESKRQPVRERLDRVEARLAAARAKV